MLKFKQIPFVLRTDIPQNYSGVLKSGISTKVRMGSVSSNQENNYLISPSELLNTVVELQKKAGVLNDLRHNLLYKSRPNTVSHSYVFAFCVILYFVSSIMKSAQLKNTFDYYIR